MQMLYGAALAVLVAGQSSEQTSKTATLGGNVTAGLRLL